ncbi:hypothetical protein ACVLD2_001817 [Paenibacillus sp. PvR052]|nr:hypothetical protein [Paenibacillus sp. PvP091]MBP1170335.1 hypothetical protein [Paenibacillus sp. PvR098]MBP2441363.1 hypothetical protein [Paenibacillus sp. PvP052]
MNASSFVWQELGKLLEVIGQTKLLIIAILL